MDNTPQHIWEQLRKGDQNALNALFSRYYNDLLRYGQHFYGQLPVVEDKIQEIFLRLWEKQSLLPQPDNILAFLIRALRNALIDENRRQQSQQKLMDHLTWLTDNTTSGKTLEEEQKQERLQIAIKELSDMQREIIFLRFYNQLPYQEIAEVVNMQYQSVRNAAHRAMKVLRKEMLG